MDKFFIQASTIYLGGITGLYKGVPIGYALESHPVITALFTALGSITVIYILYFSGTSFKKWILNKYGENKMKKKQGRFRKIMDRYGVAGLGLIATGIIGPIVTVILGMILLENTRKFMFFLTLGVIIWSVLLTLIAGVSINLFQQLFIH